MTLLVTRDPSVDMADGFVYITVEHRDGSTTQLALTEHAANILQAELEIRRAPQSAEVIKLTSF